MSRPGSRQWAHALGERAEERATTKSGRSRGIGGPQSASVTGVDPITIRQSFGTELVTAAL